MFRIGSGYDSHRLADGRDLILCGVRIPWHKGLLGHSDADAPVHALIDAILGSLALGDIGKHFPDTDPAYKNADSLDLLKKTLLLPPLCGWTVGNADITIIAQAPKLAPYIEDMRKNLAAVLNISMDRVSVKAKTAERIAFGCFYVQSFFVIVFISPSLERISSARQICARVRSRLCSG